MSLLKPHTLADRIIVELQNGSMRGPLLMENLDRSDQKYTKQALYAALRQLIREDAVVKQGGKYSLNTTWILQLQNFTSRAARQYGASATGSEILSLDDGESVTYQFANSHTLDTFWGHVQNLLLENTAPSEPIFSLNPHYWFLLAHHETERTLLQHIVASKRQFLMAVSGATVLDKLLAKEFDGTDTQYAFVSDTGENTEYLSSIGPYVLKVTLDKKIADRVDEIFNTAQSRSTQIEVELKELLSIRSTNKIKISRSSRKASQLRSRLGKYFYIKHYAPR